MDKNHQHHLPHNNGNNEQYYFKFTTFCIHSSHSSQFLEFGGRFNLWPNAALGFHSASSGQTIPDSITHHWNFSWWRPHDDVANIPQIWQHKTRGKSGNRERFLGRYYYDIAHWKQKEV